MHYDFPDVAVVLYDDLKSISSPIAQNLIDFTEFKLCGKYRFNIIPTKTLTETIGKCIDDGFAWAVVVAAGNFLQDQSSVIKTIEHAKIQQSPMSCHILDRGGYYHLHPQWFAIDLGVYDKIGRPAFEETVGNKKITTKKTQRCKENVHDDYTPWWIKPESDELIEYNSDYGYFGIDVVASLIQHGYTITNVPEEIRRRKIYCYPEHNHDELVLLINDPDYLPQDPKSPMYWFANTLHVLLDQLRKGYYVLNTEHLGNINFTMKFDRFVGVCGGIKPACIAGSDHFSDDTRVYLFDISSAAIEWQRYLIKTWDGDFSKFESVWKEFQANNPNFRPMYYNNESIDTNVEWFLQNAQLSRSEFQKRWMRYCKMQHEFVFLDLLHNDAAQRLAAMVNDGNGAYIWTSNAFEMDYLMFLKTRAWTENRSREFVEQIKSLVQVPTVFENCGSISYF